MAARLVSIIGPVGVGKTTLADSLAARLGCRVIYEDYQGNPFLDGCFKGEAAMAIASQLFFINSRFIQLNLASWPSDGLVITDYGFCQDRIFAELKLCDEDMKTYNYLAARLAEYVKQPEIIVHLDAPVEILLERIKARGRSFEQAFSEDFLQQLRQKQFDIELPENCERIIIDCEKVDIRDADELDKLIEKIGK